MRQPTSITHLHLASAINSEIERQIRGNFISNDIVKMLDMGCGKGRFLAYVSNVLPVLRPDIRFEFYGYDIQEQGARSRDYLTALTGYLHSETPFEDWDKRIEVISSEDNLPYDEGFFSYIVSNQVFEHIMNHEFVLGEIYRCLRPNGVSIHLFPVREVLREGHLRLPLVHKILDWELMKNYIHFLNSMGLGPPAQYKRRGMSIEDCAKFQADYMLKFTNYLSSKEILFLSKKYGFRSSFRYTNELYVNKLLSMIKFFNLYRYKYNVNRSYLIDRILFFILKFINNVTLVLEKPRPGWTWKEESVG